MVWSTVGLAIVVVFLSVRVIRLEQRIDRIARNRADRQWMLAWAIILAAALLNRSATAEPAQDKWVSQMQSFVCSDGRIDMRCTIGGVATICIHDGARWMPRTDGVCYMADKPR